MVGAVGTKHTVLELEVAKQMKELFANWSAGELVLRRVP